MARLLTLPVLWLLLTVVACVTHADGQPAAGDRVKTITAIRINGGADIDGALDEDFWSRAPRSGGFTQYQPDEGCPASESTFVRLAYDDEALYVGMEMYDSEPDKIMSRLTRRDRWVEGDLVHVIVDSHHDHQTAYAFSLYASGTQRDSYYFNEVYSDENWDAVWDAATQIESWGWSAEYRIPFHCLRFPCEENPVWGIYFSRKIGRKNELARWVYIPEGASGFVSHFGHLDGLSGLAPPGRMEAMPYAVSYAETEAKSPGNPDGRDYFGNLGVDLKYGISSNLTLDATVNPDFGQVEADQTVLNLSVFETWYPEKRPFFLEGSKIFETPFTLFYSRRIGRPPSALPEDADYYVDLPTATTILGAGKISGKTASGTSIGIIESVTQRERARFVDDTGRTRTSTIEPEANYMAARAMQDVLENSTVGIMGTAVNQKGSRPHYTGGVDWNLRFQDGDYECSGQVVGSRFGEGEKGWGAMASFEKEGGDHILGSISGQYIDRSLDLNRLGYLRRPDYRETWGWIQYRTTAPWWIVRKTWHNLNVGLADNIGGLKLTRGGNYNNSIELTNFWSFGGGIWADFEDIYSDRETRGGPPLPVPGGQHWWAWLNTDGRAPWQAELHMESGDNWDGRYNAYRVWMEVRPRPNIEISVAPGFSEVRGISRWLTYLEDQDGNRTDEIFGEQHMRRTDMTLRGTFTFTKDLTLQIYAQPFFAAVDYSNFKRLRPSGGFEPVDASVYDEDEERPDFTWSSVNSNIVLRWQYMPGSTVYLVWTQARDFSGTDGEFDLGRDWHNLRHTTGRNTFLVKANYWWSL
jgi:hypothetical protein